MPYDRRVPSTTYLVTVSGPDRPGVGAQLFEALSTIGVNGVLNDVAQITIRGYLVLCAEVTVDATLTREALRERAVRSS